MSFDKSKFKEDAFLIAIILITYVWGMVVLQVAYRFIKWINFDLVWRTFWGYHYIK